MAEYDTDARCSVFGLGASRGFANGCGLEATRGFGGGCGFKEGSLDSAAGNSCPKDL